MVCGCNLSLVSMQALIDINFNLIEKGQFLGISLVLPLPFMKPKCHLICSTYRCINDTIHTHPYLHRLVTNELTKYQQIAIYTHVQQSFLLASYVSCLSEVLVCRLPSYVYTYFIKVFVYSECVNKTCKC